MEDVADSEGEFDMADPVKCAEKGHCFCIREHNGAKCCWCGAYFPERAKENALAKLKAVLKSTHERYPVETTAMISEFIGANHLLEFITVSEPSGDDW